jgi:tetratricopeptide (TPR) repeat protein
VVSKELKDLYESGKPQEVLDQFAYKETQNEWAALSEEEQIVCIYYKCRSLVWLCRYEEALQTATRARRTYTSPKNRSYLLALLAAQIYTFEILGEIRLDEAQSLMEEGKAVIKALTDNEQQTGAIWIAIFEHVKGVDFFSKKELDMALKSYYKALKSFETLDDRHNIAWCLIEIGDAYFFKTEFDTALDYLQRSLTIFEGLGNKQGIATCLGTIGNVYFGQRDLDTALEYYQRALSVSEASGSPLAVYYGLTHSGAVYTDKGDPNKALDYFRQSLAVVEPLNLDWAIAYTFEYIGKAYYQKSALEIALPFFQSSLAKYETLKNDYFQERSLFYLILLSLDQQKLDQAQKYLISLQKLITRISDDAIIAHLRLRLAEALVLKQSPRMKEKIRAQALLTEIVNENLSPGFSSIAMVALCDLLLLELKATGEDEVWKEAKTLIQKFHTRAQDQQDFNMVVNALLLRAKFSTIDGELDEAQGYFDEARMIVNEKELGTLVRVETEQKEFEEDFHKWQDLIHRHTSLKERLIQTQLAEYIQEVQKEVNRSVKEN